MANGQKDPVLDEISRLGGGTATAVSDHEEDPVLDEIAKLTPPKKKKEDLEEAARLLGQATPSLTDRADKLGDPMITPPTPDSGVLPTHGVPGAFDVSNTTIPPLQGMVRGPFGSKVRAKQPIRPPLMGPQAVTTNTPQSIAPINTPKPPEGPEDTAAVLAEAGGGMPQQPGVLSHSEPSPYAIDFDSRIPLEELTPELPPEAGALGVPIKVARGVLKAVSGVVTPRNAMLLAATEGLGGALGSMATEYRGYIETAKTAAVAEKWTESAEALAKAEEIATQAKPLQVIHSAISPYFTYRMGVGLLNDVKGLHKAVTDQDWGKAAELMGEAIPNAIFTAEGVRNIYTSVATAAGVMKARAEAVDVREANERMNEARSGKVVTVKDQEQIAEAPKQLPGAPQQAPQGPPPPAPAEPSSEGREAPGAITKQEPEVPEGPEGMTAEREERIEQLTKLAESSPNPTERRSASRILQSVYGGPLRRSTDVPRENKDEILSEIKAMGEAPSNEEAKQEEPASEESVTEKPESDTTSKLPRELAGAKPRYSYGNKKFELSFESDLDKAMYILAQPKPSARDADYLAFAKSETGSDDENELRSHGQAIKDWIKKEAKGATDAETLSVPKGAGRNSLLEHKEDTPTGTPKGNRKLKNGKEPSRLETISSERIALDREADNATPERKAAIDKRLHEIAQETEEIYAERKKEDIARRHNAMPPEEERGDYALGHPWAPVSKYPDADKVPARDDYDEEQAKQIYLLGIKGKAGTPARRNNLEKALVAGRSRLAQGATRYDEIRKKGISALSDYDLDIAHGGATDSALGTAVGLTYSHLTYSKSVINAILKELGKPPEFTTEGKATPESGVPTGPPEPAGKLSGNSPLKGVEATTSSISISSGNKKELSAAAEKQGVEFRGIQEGGPGHPGAAIFQDPQSKTSVAVRMDQWSPEKLGQQIAEAREKMDVPNGPDYKKEPLTKEDYDRVVGMKGLQSQEMAKHFPTFEQLRDAMPTRRSDETLSDTARRVMRENAESDRLPASGEGSVKEGLGLPGAPQEIEEPANDEHTEAEPDESQSVGEAGDQPLERVSPEDVRGTEGEGNIERTGGEGSGADAERLGGRDQQSRNGPPGGVGIREGEIPVPAERGGRPSSGRGRNQSVTAERAGNDYRITDEDNIGSGGAGVKYRENVAAIRLLKQIEQEGRNATPEEQSKLVKYVGWGGLPQALDVRNSYYGEWKEKYQELKELLTDEEHAAALASTPNAHYTSIPVVRAIWDAVDRLGFKEGRILEPSAGTGNFLGTMPDDLAPAVRRTAVELDKVTGRILKQLYQSADVRIHGFEKLKIPNGFYDLVVGNVPFGDYKVHDPEYKDLRFNIHNYFLVKSLDKLRPGGVAALITSSSTMDRLDQKASKEFSKRADLIGAVRLPNNAFKGNALTEVTTDILFFRKRAEGEAPQGHSFTKTEELPNGVRVNEYFAKHPEMMLGSMENSGTMYRSGEPTLVAPAGQDLNAELAKAIQNLPQDAMKVAPPPASTTVEASAEAIPEYGDTKPYGLKITGGKVFRRIGDSMTVVPDFPKTSFSRLRDMLGLRNTYREVLDAELNDRPPAELSNRRALLNRQYDKFVKDHGFLHQRSNISSMRQDPDLPFVLSLESYDPKEKQGTKADIFRKKTVAARKPVEKADSAKDAMLASLAEKGRLDISHMEKITGRSAEDLQDELRGQGLIFHSPEGHWEPADLYLSGNVRKKLEEAESAAITDPQFKGNVEALKNVLPKDVTHGEIRVRIGAPWIPTDNVADFVRHIIGDQYADIAVKHVESEAVWTVNLGRRARISGGALQKWGVDGMGPVALIETALNQQVPVIYGRDSDGNRFVKKDQTEAAKEKTEELHNEFREFLMMHPERGTELAKLYNEKMNAYREREYDGSHLTLPGQSHEIAMSKIQKDDIWRGISGGNLGLYEPVGTGKTFIMAAIAMEWRRLGLAKKSMLVVPNHMVEQWDYDFRRLYPASHVLIATKEDFAADKRKEFSARIAAGDWDAVVMGHRSFQNIGVSNETFDSFMGEQLSALRQYLEELQREEGKRGPTVKEIEKSIKRLEERIAKRYDEDKKDNTIDFETLGIDGLLVDEAHYFKSLWFPTKMTRVSGVPRSDSDRALDMYLKSQYITRLNNGRGLVFATGTPISNTMAEMWNMMRYLDDARLRELGIQHFDAWAAQFGQSTENLEVAPNDVSRMRIKARFSKFTNLPELRTLFNVTGVQHSQEELKLKKPKLLNGKPFVHEIEPSSEQQEYITDLGRRADAIQAKKVDPSEDNPLKITTDGRKASFDMRMVDPHAEDHADSKINTAVREIRRIYEEKHDTKGTQLVMLDMGVPSKEAKERGTFNAYQDIKRKLVAKGIPTEEIQFIHDFPKDEQKQGLFDKMNSGDVRVLIGSTDKVGVGTNIQRRLYAIHHMDPPWRPSDIEQRNGRILRQGNENDYVEEHHYVTARTFDAYSWELLQQKWGFINDFFNGDSDAREMEDVGGRTFSPAEIKAIATGNPLIREKATVDNQVAKLERLARAHDSQQFDNRREIGILPSRIAGIEDSIKLLRADQKTRDDEHVNDPKFSITLDKKGFSERAEAGAKINELIDKGHFDYNKKGTKSGVLGTYKGFKIFADDANREGFLQGERAYRFYPNYENPLGTIQSLEGALRNLDGQIDKLELNAAGMKKDLAGRKAESGKPFTKQKELEAARKRQSEINDALKIKDAHSDDSAVEKKEEEGGGEGGNGTTMSFMGLQGLYQQVMKLVARAKNGRALKADTEGGGGDEEPPKPPAKGGVPMGPPDDDKPERAGNIRLDKLNTSEEVLDLIRETAKTHSARINAQKRGVLGDKGLKKRMEEVGLDPEKLAKLKKGTALNEAEMQVAIGIMLDKGEQVLEAQKAVQENNSTENLLRAQQLHNEYVAIQASVSGAKAESARALRIQRMISEAFQSKNKSGYEKVIEQLGGRKLAEKESEKLLQIPTEDRIGYYRFLRDHAKFTTPQKIVAYWINNILSGPGTVQRKFLGDAAMLALSTPMRPLRAAIEVPMAAMQGRDREFFMRDALAQNLAYFGAIPDGLKAGAFTLWNGFDMEDAAELDMPYRYELPGGLAVNWPTRLLAGATAMFKTIHFKSALSAISVRQALREGHKGQAVGARAAELLANPSDGMVSEAWKEAKDLALIGPPDTFTRRFLSLRDTPIPEGYIGAGLAPGKFIVPFVNIGVNIAKQLFHYSPAGAARFAKESTRKGPEGSTVLAEALIGSLVMAAFAYWASQGNMTGGAPKSPNDRDAFYRSGKQPYSFKIGNRWVSYTKGWGPTGLMAAAVSGWHDIHQSVNGKPPKSDEIGAVAGALLSGVRDQSFFRGIQNLDQAVSEPERFGAQWLSEIASGFIPFSGFDRAVASSLDPEIRQPQGIYERIISGLPVLSENVPPRLDVLGRPSTRRGGEGLKAFLPGAMPEDTPQTSVDGELARLHDKGLRNPGFASGQLTFENIKMPLSREEKSQYQRMRGTLLESTLGRVFKDPEYQSMNDDDKVKEVEEAIRQVEDFSREQMVSRIVNKRLGRDQAASVPTGPPN